MTTPEELDRERKRILRRLGLFTWGLWAAAGVLALAGGALIAWLFGSAGLPFVPTWLGVSLALLVIPAVIHLVSGLLHGNVQNGQNGSDGADGSDGGDGSDGQRTDP